MSSINEKTKKRKSNGVYYTPADISQYILGNVFVNVLNKSNSQVYNFDMCIDYILNSNSTKINSLLYSKSIIDPTCGSGEFLINAFDLKYRILSVKCKNITDRKVLDICKTLFGNDIDDESMDISKIRLFFNVLNKLKNKSSYNELAMIIKENFTNIDFISEYQKLSRKYDIIVGNPPYVEYGKYPNKDKLSNNFGNVYADVIKNSIDLLNENGILGYIIPLSYSSTGRMMKIRRFVDSTMNKQFILNFADRPDCLFDGVHQKLNILISQKTTGNNNIYVSNYKHWYSNERETLFDDISVLKSNYDFNEFIPKIGNEIEKSIFNKVFSKDQKNIFDSQSDQGPELYLNMRACFWIKAFSFNPGSKEYKKFVFDKDKYHFILCVLNSSLFWIFWTIMSDCWHITSKELKHFYIPEKIEDHKVFETLSDKLELSLEKTKRYVGTKQVDYEYKHKFSKSIINDIDSELQKIYKLTDEELNYIKTFALKYRMGDNALNVKTIDLFSGCGGFSCGFKKAGFQIVSAVEFDDEIAKSYELNHEGTRMINDDIKNVDNEKIFKRGDADVIIGGPPCQGFSMAGARIRNGFIDDPRNYLFKHYFNVVKIVKPKLFILENVKGILSLNDGAIFNEIKRSFEDPNNFDGEPYIIKYKVVKAKEYGIPQNRERTIIIGTLKDFNLDEEINKTRKLINEKYPGFFDNVSVWEAISDLNNPTGTGDCSDLVPESKYQKYLKSGDGRTFNHIKTKHSDVAMERIKKIKINENYLVLDENIKSVHSGSYGRLDPNGIAPTITTRFDTPSGGKFIHPFQNRTITPREAARIQSFPDDFKFYGSKSCVCKQIGNAVPPKLAFFFANMIRRLLNEL